MTKNILDNFKKCYLTLKTGIACNGVGDITVLPYVELVQFDIIGGLFDFEGEVYFIPWSNVSSIQIAED